MTSIDLFVIIAAVSLAGIAVFLIPLLVQTRQTLQRADTLLETLNRDVPTLVKTLNEAAGDIKEMSASLTEKIDRADALVHNLERSGEVLLATSKLLKETATPILTEIGALRAGVRAFLYFFTRSNKSF